VGGQIMGACAADWNTLNAGKPVHLTGVAGIGELRIPRSGFLGVPNNK